MLNSLSRRAIVSSGGVSHSISMNVIFLADPTRFRFEITESQEPVTQQMSEEQVRKDREGNRLLEK